MDADDSDEDDNGSREMQANLRYTALGSISISDSITNLSVGCFLPMDVDTAVQRLSCFRFDPKYDHHLFDGSFWTKPFDAKIESAQKVLKKFEKWYARATNQHNEYEKILCGVAALTGSHEQIDAVVWNAYDTLVAKFEVEFQDSDDSIYKIPDFHQIRLDQNLNAAIFTEQTYWWCRRFEEQMRRTINMPTMPFHHWRAWYDQSQTRKQYYEWSRYRRNIYRASGVTKKQGRRKFNKSLRAFCKRFGPKTASKFLHGKNLWLRGNHFVWKLKIESLIRDGNDGNGGLRSTNDSVMRETINPSNMGTPFQIDICNHQLEKLASACIVFEDTPILEQALCIALHLPHPEDELEMLRAANLYLYKPLGRQNELLTSMPNVKMPLSDLENLRIIDSGCPTIDDGIENHDCDNEETDPFVQALIQASDDRAGWDRRNAGCSWLYPIVRDEDIHIDDDFSQAFSAEIGLDKMWSRELRTERRERECNPVVVRLREKLMTTLDVDPDLFHYMRFPEARFFALKQYSNFPRLEAYIAAKLPLIARNF